MALEILIGKGVGGVKFGQSELQVIDQLGQPDKVYELERTKRLQYFDLQLEISLEYEQDNRFGLAEVKDSNALLFGQKLIGRSVESVLSVVAEQIADEPEHEDYGGLETYFYESHWLELQFELGRLRSINIGVLWLDNETPDWPS